MENINLVQNYFEEFFTGKADHSRVRRYLTDDFVFKGPLMTASGVDDYIGQLTAMGGELELYADVRQLIGNGDRVAALVDFQGPEGTITYSQWFTLRNGKFAKLEVVYDPRTFLQTS